jgi:tRNA G18 (ribose-2'-O)-methylase SpoU
MSTKTPATKHPATKPKPAKKAAKKPTKPRELNVRQQRFCEFIVAGVKPADAWLQAGYEVTRFVAQRNAQESLSNPVIVAHIAKLRAPEQAANRLTRDRKLELLRQIAEAEANPLDARLRAMAEDSKMQGHYEPEQHVIESGPKTLEAVRERMRMIVSPMVRLEPRS